MDRFLQLHVLTPYAPSNLNRDDLGKPKSALFGGANRLRISSQCLKRAWRTSDVFSNSLLESIGKRTRNLKSIVLEELRTVGMSDSEANKRADEWINKIYNGDKKTKEKASKKNSESEEESSDKSDNKNEILHIGLNEIQNIKTLIREGKSPNEIKQSDILCQQTNNEMVDIALFGRMIAKSPDYNIEAAAQVAHAITTHKVADESDYFTAVDDLNLNADTGSGHLGELEFGSGLFYHYICINRELLIKNLGNNTQLAQDALKALVEAIVTVSPNGKQNSFAALSRAVYVLAETGEQQPRSLSMAYFNPVDSAKGDLLNGSIDVLTLWRNNIDETYGPAWNKKSEINVMSKSGSLTDLKKFVAE